MAASKIFCLFTFILTYLSYLSPITSCYDYNSFEYGDKWPDAPRYPEWCCPLEWLDTKLGQPLPREAIIVGNLDNKNYAFTRSRFPNAALKSNLVDEWPNWLFKNFYYSQNSSFYPILSNPHSCKLGGYVTSYKGELVPTNHPRWFFPSLGSSKYGDFVKYDNYPGYMAFDLPAFRKMTSVTASTWIYDIDKIEMLYVDCAGSIPRLLNGYLSDVELLDDLEEIIFNRVQSSHKRKFLINNSGIQKSFPVEFNIKENNAIVLKLFGTHLDIFNSTYETYEHWSKSSDMNFLEQIGFEGLILNMDQNWIPSLADKNVYIDKDNNQFIFLANGDSSILHYDQEIDVPPHSKVIVTAFTKPIKGLVKVKLTYDLYPSGQLGIDKLKPMFEKYVKKFEYVIDEDKIVIKFDGFLDIDADHEIDLDVQTFSMAGNNLPSDPSDGFDDTPVEPLDDDDDYVDLSEQ